MDASWTKNFPEEFILGQLYQQALESKGFHVTYKESIGSTELIQTSPTSGKINMYPEYTGVMASVATALGSKFTSTINAVSAKLSQNAIVAMNKAVIVDKQSAAKVAKSFLQANGLL